MIPSDVVSPFRRIVAMFAARRHDADLNDEIQEHLDLIAQEHVRRGMSPDAARAAARREFGGIEPMKERYRDQRGLPFVDSLRQDLRFAGRTFVKAPGLMLVVLVTLALGIGANTAAFSVLNAVILRPLPLPHPEQLFVVAPPTPTAVPQRLSFSMFERLRDAAPAPAQIAATSRVAVMYAVEGASAPERVRTQLVSGEYFAALGVTASSGRLLTPADNRVPGGHPVAVISNQWWRRRFGAAPDVVGRQLLVNGTSFTVVGIAAAPFEGTWVDAPADLWIPLMMQHDVRYAQNYSSHGDDDTKPWVTQGSLEWLQGIGRASTADWPAVGAALKLAYQQGMAQQAAPFSADSPTRAFYLQRRITLNRFANGASNQRDRLVTPLLALLGMVGLILLVACANTANLLLARASARQREIAIRLSMGASRGRLVRQLLTESTMLVAAAAASGLIVARWFASVLMAGMTGSATAPALLDVRVLAFTAGVSFATAMLFGLLPAVRSVDVAVADTLRADARTMTRSGSRFSARELLVVGQVALSLVLVVGAALCARSLRYLSQVPLGFDVSHVVSVAMNTRAAHYEVRDLAALHARLIERVAALPGVRSAAVAECQLVAGCRNSSTIRVPGYDPPPGERLQVNEGHVGLGYFSTVGIPLIAGRDFEARDRAPCVKNISTGCDIPAAAIVNRALADRYFPGRDAVGQRFNYGGMQAIEIVGVVEDARVMSVQEPPTPTAFYPLREADAHAAALEVATLGDPAELVSAVRQALLAVEPSLPVSSVRPLSQQVGRNIDSERFIAALTAGFGMLALGLASFGLFGVMSYTVTGRTPELGVRLALGAQPVQVLWMVFRESLVVVAGGIAVGIPIVLIASRAIAGMLVGLDAADAGTIASAAGVLLAAAALAAFFPAWRASRVDPMAALRHE
jgi:predicted permease